NSGLHLRTVQVTLEGLTLKGHYTGVAVSSGGLTLRHCILDANRELGATVDGIGSTLTIEESLIRGSTSANAAFGRGLQVQNHGKATISGSAFIANQAFGVYVTENGTLTINDSVIAQTVADVSGAYGIGALSNTGEL